MRIAGVEGIEIKGRKTVRYKDLGDSLLSHELKPEHMKDPQDYEFRKYNELHTSFYSLLSKSQGLATASAWKLLNNNIVYILNDLRKRQR